MFYKIKALHGLGVEITLHCFHYGRAKSPELEMYCRKVYYYERKTSASKLLSSDPFIVVTRKSDELLKNLLNDDAPILFEGLHCCGYVSYPGLSDRKKIVRTHNIEHDYYRALERVEKKWSRRQYFKREADKLQKFESVLNDAQHILAISPADAVDLSSRYKNVQHVMAFHPNEEVDIREGKGSFAFYHGNLEVGENNQAALFLANEVFNGFDYPLMIAGNNPSSELMEAVQGKPNITLKSNISTAEIDHLISEAHVNILPTFQATGIKLKLLAALMRGRHCMVNAPMVANTGLESLCIIHENASSMRAGLQAIRETEFTQADIAKRKTVLDERFSNRRNAEKILKLL